MKNKISMKNWVVISILVLLSIISIRSNARPLVYIGMIGGFVGIIFIGLFSNRLISAIFGGIITITGYILRMNFPQDITLKGKKLEEFLINNEQYNQVLKEYIIIFVIFGIMIGFLAGMIGEKLHSYEKNKISVNNLTNMSIFIAISVIINSMRVGDVSFGGFPIIFSGYVLGPVYGFIVGGISDLVGFLVRPSAFPFNPLFTFTSALTGLIPILVTKLFTKKNNKFTFINILIGIFIGQIFTSVILVPIFSVILYGRNTFWVLAGLALIKQIISIPIYAFLITVIGDRLAKVIEFNGQFK